MKRVDFYYSEGDSSVSISLRKDDVEWLASQSGKIKKLNAPREKLDYALASVKIADKMKTIRDSKKFFNSFDEFSLHDFDFNATLFEFLEIYDVSLESRVKFALNNLNIKSFEKFELTEKQQQAVCGFLNFQLHYVKIILGVIIAAKIH